ncbi:MAG: DNA polymerase II large subunit [Thermoplasmata archaeon]|nr:MAG: DNA polymerase II large subunit [Thermoplasmata archaeon]
MLHYVFLPFFGEIKSMGGETVETIAASKNMQEYFNHLQKDIDQCYLIASEARKKGFDPMQNVEIPQARDLAQRVEELVGPKDIAPIIRKVTKKIVNRELVSLELARFIVNGKKYKFKSTEQALDQAIRTGLAILTEGVLVAPLEGIADVQLGSNSDGSNYVDLFFSGPIRSAGGTGQAMSVLIADVVRRELGIGAYLPTENEIERYKEEIPLYKRIQHLQYTPSVDEIHQIVSNCPICINGEGTEKEEITGNRDLPRIESNRIRGGACLVIAEGLCLKAPKLMKHVTKLKLKGWDFLDIFVNKNKNNDNDEKESEEGNCIPEIPPSTKYIQEVIAGRPVFSYPSRKGGFRLRYGRARTAGLASTAINPASMFLLDEFIAIGTQMKMERPGKATIGTPCSILEPPLVLTYNDDLIELRNPDEIDYTSIKEIIDVGEILVPYGEFLENNAILPNASFSFEWWIQELQEQLQILPKKNTIEAIEKADDKTHQMIQEKTGKTIDLLKPQFQEALFLSETYNIPLHPRYNLFWHDITAESVKQLAEHIKNNGTINNENNLIIPNDENIKSILVDLGAIHQKENDILIIDFLKETLICCLGLTIKENKIIESKRYQIINQIDKYQNNATVEFVSKLAGITIQEKAPFRIGTRMGRPEKAAERKMKPPPHVLFPLGNYGSNQRLFSKAADHKKIDVEAGKRECTQCGKTTFRLFCICGGHTEPIEDRIETFSINIKDELNDAKKHLQIRNIPDTIKGVQGTISKHKTPEPIEKGILRAKHAVSVFKDGTIRFDMTDAPLTHFKPRELHISIEKIKSLGYYHDYQNKPLECEDQICELKVQDIVVSQACAEYFMKTANFVDDLLIRYYKMKPFYSLKRIEDLTGHLVIGLAPHTSGGSLARIIGFTSAQVCFSHPFYHAAKRRNCLSPNTDILISNSEKPLIKNLEELYQNNISNEIVVDDFGTKQKNMQGICAYSLNSISGKFEVKEIKSIIKSKSPRHLIKVKLKSGREFISSPYHRVLVWSNNKIQRKKTLELEENDKFFTPQKIDLKNNDVEYFDLLSEFLHFKDKNDIVVRGIDSLVKKCINDLGGLSSTSKKLNINKKTFSNYIYRDSIPIPVLFKILELCNLKINSIPKECKLGVKRDHTCIPRIIKVNKKFMRLLGYYIAEGHARFTKKNCYQIGLACTEKEIYDDIVSCIKDVFSTHVYCGKHGVFISNRLVYDFFVHVLNVGSNDKDKRIPSRLMSLPKHKIRELLKTYFSGGGSVEKNRLHVTCSSVDKDLLKDIGLQLLRFGIFYRLKEEREKKVGGLAKKFYDKKGETPVFDLYYISIRSTYAKLFYEKIGFSLQRKQLMLESVISKESKPRIELFGNFILDGIKEISTIRSDFKQVYDLEVDDLHNFLINDFVISSNCDGDEDGGMLLMDALLNFSIEYIPDKRGGKMDLPLILTTRLDPSEVDKEAHNVDCLSRYPLDFYRATLHHEHPKDWEDKMDVVGSRLGTPLQYEQFGFTHDTFDISQGPVMSRYKTLKTMMDKMNSQLNLAAKIRAVDEADVAYKVIERHFLPDIIGNLRAFSKQSVRCPICNITYRRIPLSGVCRTCGGKLILTVHEKSVKKYLEISKEIADRYNIPSYARQRINLVEKNIDSLFSSDKIRKTKLTDFL